MICALALALAGCGDSEERGRAAAPPTVKGDWGPSEPGAAASGRGPSRRRARRRRPTVASALDAGTVGVVGVEGVVGVRPASLDVSADGTLDDLRWQRWDSGGAEGTGTLTLRDCDPSCASGGKDRYPATIRLSSPRLCGRAAYFDRARVELDGRRRAAIPATYVRAPC